MSDRSGPRLARPPGSLTHEEFLKTYGGVYEDAPWVADAVWPQAREGRLDTVESLHNAMREAVEAAPGLQQLALIRAHPVLAGGKRTSGAIAKASRQEQASAGLDRLPPDQDAEFAELNRAYRDRFGFPFIIAVRGLTVGEVLDAFRRRLGNARDAELAQALEEIHKIARLRLDAMTEEWER